jgi:hypothetical protein
MKNEKRKIQICSQKVYLTKSQIYGIIDIEKRKRAKRKKRNIMNLVHKFLKKDLQKIH